MISGDLIEDVRRAADAVELIGRHVPLRKSGTSFVGRCPFHDETEGSFRVYPADKRFVCFGCGARGDLFEFFQRIDGKAFPAVVRELATLVGIRVPERELTAEEQRERNDRRELLRACEAAAAHWEALLWGPDGTAARAYLAERGVREECARAFRLGFAPMQWHELHKHLASMGFAGEVQHAAGLLAAKDGSDEKRRFYDRFRGRIMIPIRDAGGRVVGFGGRALGSDGSAKYLNGPETPLYKKARALFAIDKAAEAVRRGGRAVLVEGFFDAIALHQAGYASAVATCGTAITPEQLATLARVGCGTVVLLFDGDPAGAAAPARNARVLLASGLSTFVARLPSAADRDIDPDTFVRRSGAEALERVLTGAKPLTEHLIDEAVRAYAGGAGQEAAAEHKLRVVRELAPFVVAAPDGLPRVAFEKAIARALHLDVGPLRAEVDRVTSTPKVRLA